MTYYGTNPSFTNGRLPLLSNPLRRAREFQVFTDSGAPTPERSKLDERGLPVADGRSHGLRVFESMGGTMPVLDLVALKARYPHLNARAVPGEALFVWSKTWTGLPEIRLPDSQGRWHVPSLEAIAYTRPRFLRTLDWQRTNERPDWTRPRTRANAPLQGDVMAAEVQREAALLLKCHLWFCVPPRFGLPVAEYEARLEELLRAIHDPGAKRPPVLEYGNELWNAAFPVHGWLLQREGEDPRLSWQAAAALEIAILKRVADRVFGPPEPMGLKPYYLFVGGQFTVSSHLYRLLTELHRLGIIPDMAGPAFYVTPLKSSVQEWEAAGAVPSQDEIRASCLARLEEIENGSATTLRLSSQVEALRDTYRVPYFACYEAGQSLIAGRAPWRRAALEAQGTEWMAELYRGIRRVAEEAGVDVLNWYSAATDQTPSDPRVDVFGLLDSCDLTKAPLKARAARGE